MPKKKQPAQEPDEPAEEEVAEMEQAAAAQKKSKKDKKRKAEVAEADLRSPPSDDQDDEEGGGEEDDGAADEKSAKERASRRRARAKVSGYRKIARKCGFEKRGGPMAASGMDIMSYVVTLSDTKRLCTSVPHDYSHGSYEKNEALARMELIEESLPASALAVAQAHCESVMRGVINEAVLRMVESGYDRKTLDAATVMGVVRKYAPNMDFTAVVPPPGVIKQAQASGLIGVTTDDANEATAFEKECRDLAKASSAIKKRIADGKAARAQALKAAKGSAPAVAAD